MPDLKYSIKTLRASAVLTNAYVAATTYGPTGINDNIDPVTNNQLILYIGFTLGSLTSAQLKIEFSDDNTNWYQESSSSINAGSSTDSQVVHNYTASGNYRLPIQIRDRYVRVSAQGTGTVTSSLMSILGILSYNP